MEASLRPKARLNIASDHKSSAVLRLAEHSLGLLQAAEDIGDTEILNMLRPVLQTINKGLMAGLTDETPIKGRASTKRS